MGCTGMFYVIWLCRQTGVFILQLKHATGIRITETTCTINSPPEENGHQFADDIFRCIFMNEKWCIFIKISLQFVPKGPIDSSTARV